MIYNYCICSCYQQRKKKKMQNKWSFQFSVRQAVVICQNRLIFSSFVLFSSLFWWGNCPICLTVVLSLNLENEQSLNYEQMQSRRPLSNNMHESWHIILFLFFIPRLSLLNSKWSAPFWRYLLSCCCISTVQCRITRLCKTICSRGRNCRQQIIWQGSREVNEF